MADRLPRQKQAITLYCFSPPVMLATFAIELLLAIYVRTRYGTTKLSQLVIFTLVCLALFQGVEYHLCSTGVHQLWLNIGLIAITFLPPLGIHLVAQLSGNKRFLLVGYAMAALYSGAVLFLSAAKGAVCGGNYIIIETWPANVFGLYYFVLLFMGISEAWYGLRLPTVSPRHKAALGWLIVGYASFMVPMAVAYVLVPTSVVGTASIMCGFAVILAFILALRVMPLGSEDKK